MLSIWASLKKLPFGKEYDLSPYAFNMGKAKILLYTYKLNEIRPSDYRHIGFLIRNFYFLDPNLHLIVRVLPNIFTYLLLSYIIVLGMPLGFFL